MSSLQVLTSAQQHQQILERDQALSEARGYREGVSAAIPCYNQAEFLQQALQSLYDQTLPPREIIIIDDGSDVPIVLASEPDDYPHIDVRVVRVTNRGLPAARNAALMLARCEAFLPLDADDWLDPCYIEKTLPLLEDADVVLTGLQEHG